jgi:hypothetical protein
MAILRVPHCKVIASLLAQLGVKRNLKRIVGIVLSSHFHIINTILFISFTLGLRYFYFMECASGSADPRKMVNYCKHQLLRRQLHFTISRHNNHVLLQKYLCAVGINRLYWGSPLSLCRKLAFMQCRGIEFPDSHLCSGT